MKVKVFDVGTAKEFNEKVNEFIKDKEVVNIKETTFTVPRTFRDGVLTSMDIRSRVVIMYEENIVDIKEDKI